MNRCFFPRNLHVLCRIVSNTLLKGDSLILKLIYSYLSPFGIRLYARVFTLATLSPAIISIICVHPLVAGQQEKRVAYQDTVGNFDSFDQTT